MIEEPFVRYVEERLQQWAEWYSRGNLYGLGYPPCSMEYRLMTEGIVSRSAGPHSLPCNEEAEEIEALIKEMASQNAKMALALRCQYFTNGSLRIKARKLEVSHMQLKYYLGMAHQWLAGRLSGKKKRSRF